MQKDHDHNRVSRLILSLILPLTTNLRCAMATISIFKYLYLEGVL